MEVVKDSGLWESFNLGQGNPDQAGGLLYFCRYLSEYLANHRTNLINILKDDYALTLKDIGNDEIVVCDTKELNTSEREKIFILLEELSVVNEAFEYIENSNFVAGDINLDTIVTAIKHKYYECIINQNIADAYYIVTVSLPQIYNDLLLAHQQNDCLSLGNVGLLQELKMFCETKAQRLNNPTGSVVFHGNNRCE